MFRKFNLGPHIGKRTWSGLVGILGFPVLMDGGSVTAPNLAFWNENGLRIENEGVPSGYRSGTNPYPGRPSAVRKVSRLRRPASK
jgi:hypothetical protein